MILIRRLFLALCLLTATRAAAQTTQPVRPIPGLRRVMIILVDGLRPDLALRADTPTIHQMLKDGSFTLWANTTAESVTLPSCTSALTGVIPIRHRILWDMDLPLTQPVAPAYPTVFQLAKGAGYTTAMAAGKSKFINLAVPGSLDWSFVTDKSKCTDAEVMAPALAILCDHKPDVFFVHLPSVDNVGHSLGWASDEQLAAISRADANIHMLLATLDDLHLRDSTMVLLTADHGGAGFVHGPDDIRSRFIPWIVTGPGIRKGLDLTTFGNLTVNTEDTFSTACYVLGIRIHKLPIDGKPVMEIFDQAGQELMHDK
jgi:predicted AlkP superfamily pyrophosphatase or phosphodiesterase